MTLNDNDGIVDGEFTDNGYGRVSSGTSPPSFHYINETGEPDELVLPAMRANREIANLVEQWSQSLSRQYSATTTLDVFNRRRWDGVRHIHAQMSQCAWATENDDILSTLVDVIEGLTFQKCRFELFDEDQEDMWNQWGGLIDLDTTLRQCFREIFKVSQVYVGLWWEQHIFQVRDNQITETIQEFEAEKEQQEHDELVKERERFVQMSLPGTPVPPPIPDLEEDGGPGKGNRKRRKKFAVTVPTELTIFDPTKVLPVGTLMFGRERFAYIASEPEHSAFTAVLNGDVVDGTVLQLIEQKYTPTEQDKIECGELGVDHNRLWLFKEDAVFRHTLTRAEYERYAPIRLKSVLEILELKQHLRASDRASLVGNTNFIVVITKGTDKLPAHPAEIENLQEQARVIARLPVLVGDHRLEVKIVSPALDNTLQETRWQNLDSRLVFKSLQSFMPIVQGGNSSSGVSEMSRVIARGLESKRHMLVRSLERHIFKKILDRNESVLDEKPNLLFSPKRITLDFKSDMLTEILKLRDRGDISRETTLEELDYDQEIEVLRRARETVQFDKVFQSSTPHASPLTQPFSPNAPPQVNAAPNQGQPGSNVGPKGQPRTEGGRPSNVKETKPRAKKATS